MFIHLFDAGFDPDKNLSAAELPPASGLNLIDEPVGITTLCNMVTFVPNVLSALNLVCTDVSHTEPVNAKIESPLVPEEPLLPLVPELPLEPEVPELPEEPDVPEVPLLPLEPDVPLLPELPLVPEVPDEPEDPLVPLLPLLPEVPELPDEPDVPDVPEVPEEPAALNTDHQAG